MSEVSAAILSAQLKKLNHFLEKRRRNAYALSKMLEGVDAVLPSEHEGRASNWYLYTIRVRDRDRVLEHLRNHGVGATVYYRTPIHLYPYYRNLLGCVNLPKTEQAAAEVISLPIHPAVSEAELEQIASSVKSALPK